MPAGGDREAERNGAGELATACEDPEARAVSAHVRRGQPVEHEPHVSRAFPSEPLMPRRSDAPLASRGERSAKSS